jgi:hypothetical protein
MKRESCAIALLALFTAACGSVHIARINADPSRYANRTVSINGRVTNSVGVLGTGGYQLDDGTGKIFVISRTGVPSSGSAVRVTGRVTPGATVLGKAIGVAIREESHHVR